MLTIAPAPLMMAILSLSREPIEAPRIVDEERVALRIAWRDLTQQIDEIAVVGHFLEIRMRPIGAPERTVAEIGDQLAREWDRVLPRRPLTRDALGAADFHPDVLLREQREQRAKVGMVDALGGVDAAHVIDDHRHGRALERGRELGDA